MFNITGPQCQVCPKVSGEPGALRLLAPQRGLIAIVMSRSPTRQDRDPSSGLVPRPPSPQGRRLGTSYSSPLPSGEGCDPRVDSCPLPVVCVTTRSCNEESTTYGPRHPCNLLIPGSRRTLSHRLPRERSCEKIAGAICTGGLWPPKLLILKRRRSKTAATTRCFHSFERAGILTSPVSRRR